MLKGIELCLKVRLGNLLNLCPPVETEEVELVLVVVNDSPSVPSSEGEITIAPLLDTIAIG